MKRVTKFIALAIIAVTMTSCYTSRVAVGDIHIDSPTYEANKVNNPTLIYGLVPLKNGQQASQYVGKHKNYIVKNQMSFIDGLLGVITLGIYTPTTTTYYIPISDPKE